MTVNIYKWWGKFYYTCGRYKSMLYDDTLKLEASAKSRFPHAPMVKQIATETDPISVFTRQAAAALAA